jgi:hypothetical protein
MKKPSKIRKSSHAKAPASQRKRQPKTPADMFLDALENLDEETVTMLQQMMQNGIGLGPDMFGSDDPVDLFAEYIDLCTRIDGDDDKNEILSDLVGELEDLRLASNGGSGEAREKIQAIFDLLDDAIERHALHGVDLMLIAKVFAEAGWDVPDNLKQAVAEAFQDPAPDMKGDVENNLVSTLLEAMDLIGQNPFDVYENLNSLVAGFPSEACVKLLSELIFAGKTVIDQAVAGFVLHPDPVIAESICEALAASAARTPVASEMIERLVRIRAWLPPARQTYLDATIRAMRLNAQPPAKTQMPRVIKYYISVCDGSGTRSLFFTQKAGVRYQFASVMMKPDGVADALLLRDLPKSEMDEMVRQMKSAMLVTETDLAGVAGMLGLAIADNCVSGKLPPFKLAEVTESLDLGLLHPDHASPLEIITGLLADQPSEQINSATAARAHADMLGNEFEHQWFEAGEVLEDLLYPIKGSKQRAVKLMKDYLPDRRLFWARQCALSALATRGDRKTRHPLWKQLALVGRDIASDMPLDQIPLMKQIAQVSVQAFESRLRGEQRLK